MNDTSVVAAMAVGFVSFVSPCVLPLVPGYLSAVSGVAIGDLEQQEKKAPLKVLAPALLFCLSFTVLFVALGASASGIGSFLQQNRLLLNKIAGVVIIAMGIYFISAPFVTKLNRSWHPEALIKRAGRGGPVVAGAAFAFAWTPCVGPTLSAILVAASTEGSVTSGAVLLAFYSAGMAIPFLASALAFNSAIKAFSWFKRHYLVITALAGLILIGMGILIYTNQLFQLNLDAQRLLDSLGINFFGDI